MFVSSQIRAPILTRSGLATTVFNGKRKREKQTIEEIVLKAVRHDRLARGLIVYFAGMEKRVLPNLRLEDGEQEFVGWALEVGKDTLETGLDLDLVSRI